MAKEVIHHFLFNCEWKANIIDLPDKSRLRLYEAIIDYADTGALPKLSPMEKVSFEFMRKEVDRYQEKYEAKVKRNTENANKRWRRNDATAYDRMPNDATAYDRMPNDATAYSGIKSHSNSNPNPNPNPGLSNDNIQKEIVFTNNSQKVRDPYKQIVALWNEMLGDKLPKVQIVTEKRKASIKARLSEFGEFQNWLPKCREIFEKIGNSRFMCGENGTNWKANFDWLFGSPNNWVKVIEGNYDKSGIRDSVAERMHYDGEHNPHAYDEAEEYSKWQEENVLK